MVKLMYPVGCSETVPVAYQLHHPGSFLAVVSIVLIVYLQIFSRFTNIYSHNYTHLKP